MLSLEGLRDEFKDMKVNLDSAVGEYRAIIDQQNQRIEGKLCMYYKDAP